MINITIDYFAILGEQAQCQSEKLQTTSTTPRQVYHELCQKHPFTLTSDDLKAAVNDQFVDWDHQLNDGDKIVFIPPVSGG